MREYVHKLEGFNELRDENYKTQMVAARLTAGIVLNAFIEKSFDLDELWPFPWEKKESGLDGSNYRIDKETFERRAKAWQLM